MTRRAKTGAKEETALVPTRVVRSEFLEESGDNALAHTVDALAAQNTELMRLMTSSYKDMVLERKIMADVVNDSLKQQIELTKAQQELLDKKEDRKLKREKERANQELMQELAGSLKALLPVIASKFAKAPILTEKETVVLRSFVTSLRQNQLEQILCVFDPAQRSAFLSMLQALPDEPGGPMKPPEGTNNGTH